MAILRTRLTQCRALGTHKCIPSQKRFSSRVSRLASHIQSNHFYNQLISISPTTYLLIFLLFIQTVLVSANCDEAASNALLRALLNAVQGEARRQRLNLLEEDSIQHLDRVCQEALANWAKPGNDKLNSAFQKIDQVKGKMQ